jgi:chorismate mutase/prephenate dehydratase
MSAIITLGPVGSDCYQAALQYSPTGTILLCNRIIDVLAALTAEKVDYAIIPVYNTREGEIKEYFRHVTQLTNGFWVDNVVLPIHLSLATFGELGKSEKNQITTIVGRNSVLRQCEEYIDKYYPDATLMAVHDIDHAMTEIIAEKRRDHAVIESESLVVKHGFHLAAREVVAHNRTRFAVIGKQPSPPSGYDATTIITRPLRDRVGMLVDILGEFTRRGINILDLQTDNDIKTQKLSIYLEVEGHQDDTRLRQALQTVEDGVIQEPGALKVLGSFPRVDMRVKLIKSFGFVGTGEMSQWFTERLTNEGYTTYLTGRFTDLQPGQMIPLVDVVVVCVPISATAKTIKTIGPLLRNGQALIILAGESEVTIQTALQATSPGVEVMFVHNLWGPQAATMKDKNAVIVRTTRSGAYCSEFEAFLYKHGADIIFDSATKHDLLMGVSQKLPTTLSVALAMTLKEHNISYRDINNHSTLTSLYGILAMARIHNQNPRTYAEIMATSGDGRKIVRSFAENLLYLIDLADQGDILGLAEIMNQNRDAMPQDFLEARMAQAKAVDDLMSRPGVRIR